MAEKETPSGAADVVPGSSAVLEPKGKTEDLSQARKAFQELLEKQKADESLEPPKPAPEAKEKPQKAAAKPAAKPTAEKPPAEKRDPAIERLRTKLALAGNPKKAIESATDDEVREWWRHQEERELSHAEALSRASTLEKQLKSKTTEKPEEPPKGVPTSDSDLEEIALELRETFGEAEAGTFLTALRKLTEPLRAQVTELQETIRQAQTMGAKTIAERNRARLAERLPILQDSESAWKAVDNEARASWKADPDRFTSDDEAYDAAVTAIYGAQENGHAEPETPETDEEASTLAARIEASTPTASAKKTKPRPATPLEGAFAAFKILQKEPEDVVGASREYRRAIST